MATPPHEQQSATLLYLLTMLTQKGARKVVRKSWKQRFRSLQTTVPDVRNFRSGRQHGTVRTNHDIEVRFQVRRRGRPSERISGTGETIR